MTPSKEFTIYLCLLTILLGIGVLIWIVYQVFVIGLAVQASDFKIDTVRDERIKNEVLIYGNKHNSTNNSFYFSGVSPLPVTGGNIGEASWYDYDYPKGSGNWITKHKFVAASRDFKRGSMVRVTRLSDGKYIDVKITDYGPKKETGRIIDLGSLAFEQLQNLSRGTVMVSVKLVK